MRPEMRADDDAAPAWIDGDTPFPYWLQREQAIGVFVAMAQAMLDLAVAGLPMIYMGDELGLRNDERQAVEGGVLEAYEYVWERR